MLNTKASLKYLEGKKITRVRTNSEKDILVFDVQFKNYQTFVNTQSLVAIAVGDCCSQTWFEDIFAPKQLVGGVVTSAEDIEVPQPEEDDDAYEVLQDYGIRITTDLGVCDIVYRNSSNGYYGGYCEYELAWDQTGFKSILEDS